MNYMLVSFSYTHHVCIHLSIGEGIHITGTLTSRVHGSSDALPQGLDMFIQEATYHRTMIVYVGIGSMLAMISAQKSVIESFIEGALQVGNNKHGKGMKVSVIIHTTIEKGTHAIPDEKYLGSKGLELQRHSSAKYFLLNESVNHSVLFQHCDIIFHHGGAGTTFSSSKSGISSASSINSISLFLSLIIL